MINIKRFIKKLHNFHAKSYFADNEESVHKIMSCEPKKCLELGIPMDEILQIYRQAIVHLNQNSRSGEICRNIVQGLHEVKPFHAETDFV